MNLSPTAGKLRFTLRPYFVYHRVRYLTASFVAAQYWIILTIVLLGMNFLPNGLVDPFSDEKKSAPPILSKIPKTEKFSEKVAGEFQSIDNLILYIRRHARYPQDKYLMLEEAAHLLKHRFIHAYAIYTFRENWIAVLAGRFVWRDLSAKVIPDDILQNKVAACSQISIIFMSLCKQLSIPTRKIGLQGHYALEAFVNNRWYYFDLDLKPDFSVINGRKSLEAILHNKEQFKLYANTILDSAEIAYKFSKIEYGLPDTDPAPRAYLFHLVTGTISHWAWILALAFALKSFRRKRSLLKY